jgi:NAD(P)H-hydrate epimerase
MMSHSPPTLDRRQSREVDRRAIEEYGMLGLVLMENAGRGVVDKLFQFGIAGPVVVCCGKGNNAGDGFVIARHLDLRRQEVHVLLWADPAELAGDALANYAILAKSDVPILQLAGGSASPDAERVLRGAGWIVDALLGTGAQGAPRPPLAEAIDLLNLQGARKLAVDLPSGLDCDLGVISPHTFVAEHTCTFVAPKPGFYAPGAERYTGVVHVLDIGAPRKLVDEMLREARVSTRQEDSSRGAR